MGFWMSIWFLTRFWCQHRVALTFRLTRRTWWQPASGVREALRDRLEALETLQVVEDMVRTCVVVAKGTVTRGNWRGRRAAEEWDDKPARPRTNQRQTPHKSSPTPCCAERSLIHHILSETVITQSKYLPEQKRDTLRSFLNVTATAILV